MPKKQTSNVPKVTAAATDTLDPTFMITSDDLYWCKTLLS